jgi:hypothetical protein
LLSGYGMFTHLRCAAAAIALCSCGVNSTLHVSSGSGNPFATSLNRDDAGHLAYQAADRAYGAAVLDSAASDLACPRTSIRVKSSRQPHFVADGCGQRAIYACPLRGHFTPGSGTSLGSYDLDCKMVLVNRIDL